MLVREGGEYKNGYDRMAVEGWPGLHGSHAHGRGTWNFKKGLG